MRPIEKHQAMTTSSPLAQLRFRSTHFWLRNWSGISILALTVYILLFSIWFSWQGSNTEHRVLVLNLAYLPPILLIVALSTRAAVHPNLARRTRQAWLAFAVAFAATLVVAICWTYYQGVLGLQVAPAWVDGVSFLSYMLLIIGIFRLPSAWTYHRHATFFLDVTIVLLGAGMLIWYFILQPIAANMIHDPLQMIVALVYPFGDVLFLFGVIIAVLSRPPAKQRWVIGLVGVSFLGFAFADLWFVYLSLHDAYQPGAWIDIIWLVAGVPFALGAHVQSWMATWQSADQPADIPRYKIEQQLPYLAVALGCGLLLVISIDHLNKPLGGVIIGVVGLMVLVVIRQIIVMRDNTGLLAERVALQSEARFASLVQNTSDIIAIVDANGIICYITPSARRIYGYEPEALIGTAATDIVHPDDIAPAQAAMARLARQTTSVFAFECRIRHQTGVWLDVETTGVNMLTDPLVAGLVLNSRDISERKAREKAEAANKAKSVFLAQMSHELRTPLTAVLGYTDLLQYEAEARNCHELMPDLQKIHNAGQHLLSLINNILILSKIEAGKLEISLETFDIAQVVHDVADTIEPLIARQRNMLEITCPTDIGVMRADPTKVRQILFNLLSNAAKFTERGTISLHISRIEESGQASIRYTVQDTGMGMTAEQMQRLFQPFTQADHTVARMHGGTGLGLALCQKFCTAMGGDIRVASSVDSGTTVTVHLPADVNSTLPQDSQAQTALHK